MLHPQLVVVNVLKIGELVDDFTVLMLRLKWFFKGRALDSSRIVNLAVTHDLGGVTIYERSRSGLRAQEGGTHSTAHQVFFFVEAWIIVPELFTNELTDARPLQTLQDTGHLATLLPGIDLGQTRQRLLSDSYDLRIMSDVALCQLFRRIKVFAHLLLQVFDTLAFETVYLLRRLVHAMLETSQVAVRERHYDVAAGHESLVGAESCALIVSYGVHQGSRFVRYHAPVVRFISSLGPLLSLRNLNREKLRADWHWSVRFPHLLASLNTL